MRPTMYFVNCKQSPQQGVLLDLFVSLAFFDRSDKTLTFLNTCLWKLETYTHQSVRLTKAQFGLVIVNINRLD